MPIKGLTDRGPQFRQIGILRKGEEKTGNAPGKDLDYFRFVTEDEDAAASFLEEFGPEPKAIRIFLPFPTKNQNFEAWQEEYTFGAIQHRCDGERTVMWRDKKGDCHFDKEDQKDCPGGCVETMRLKVVIPALNRLAFVIVTSTSLNDIIHLDEQLDALEGGRGSLQGIPLVLRRSAHNISTPEMKGKERTGKRVRREKSLLSIEPEKEWAQLVLEAQKRAAMAALTGASIGQLALPGAVTDDPSEYGLGESDNERDDGRDEEIRAVLKEQFRDLWPKTCKADDFDLYFERRFAEVRNEDLAAQLQIARAKSQATVTQPKEEGPVPAPPTESQVLEAEPVEPDDESKAMPIARDPYREALMKQSEELIQGLYTLGRKDADISALIAKASGGEASLEDLEIAQ